jgi:polyhydroxybutyrate depolymerase
VAAACAPAARGTGEAERVSLRVGDRGRSYLLYVPPAAARSARPVPLLLAFHGTGESGSKMHRRSGLAAEADRAGFMVAYPDAAVGNWAEGCDCTRADELGVNDTGFVRALVDDVAARHPVDRARVAAVGFSQGGLFVHRLACEMSDLVAGVASIASPMSAPLARRCRPARPVSVVVAMGTLDDAYPYEGRAAGARTTLGARQTAAFWRTILGCQPAPGGAAAGAVPGVIAERWAGCEGGAAVTLYTVENGRHAWLVEDGFDTPARAAALLRETAGR